LGQVLVTGGCGFIGSHIVKALLEQGMSVRVFDNLSTGRLSNINSICDEIELIEGDLRDASLIHQSMKNIEVVYHQGALASVPRSVEDPKTTHEVCVTGTLNVLEAAKDNQVRRVVYAASSSAYGSLEAPTKTEMSPLLPCSPYAAAKLCGELYCQAFTEVYGIETVRLRYFNVFGPNQDPNSPYSAVIPLFITAMLQGQTPRIFGDGQQTRDFTFVDNVVKANLLAADTPEVAGKVYNIAMGESISLLGLIERINKLLETEFVPIHAPARLGDVRHSRADISKARQELNYNPEVDFQEGLRRSVEDYRMSYDAS